MRNLYSIISGWNGAGGGERGGIHYNSGNDQGNRPSVRKVRIPIESKGKGKSGVARVVTLTYYVSEEEGKVHFLIIYDKSDADTVDVKVVQKYVAELGFNLQELQDQGLLTQRDEDSSQSKESNGKADGSSEKWAQLFIIPPDCSERIEDTSLRKWSQESLLYEKPPNISHCFWAVGQRMIRGTVPPCCRIKWSWRDSRHYAQKMISGTS